MLEQFGRELMPESIPLWQLILFVAILPGICEEIAFRGTLLYGLRRKLRPLPLAVSVGLIFGFFHVALFRIIPTAFMGVMLTAMALLTGSIFPGNAGRMPETMPWVCGWGRWIFPPAIWPGGGTWQQPQFWHLPFTSCTEPAPRTPACVPENEGSRDILHDLSMSALTMLDRTSTPKICSSPRHFETSAGDRDYLG